MPRFIPTRNNTGIPAISDCVRNRLVAIFFLDKGMPGGAERMRDLCCDELNREAERMQANAKKRKE